MMSESKHTPGPWRIFETDHGSKIIGIGSEDGAGVADAGFGLWGGDSDEARANARLVAAAPELLEALKYLVMHCKGLDRFEGNPINEAIRAGREAIAKAEGRS